MLAIHASFPVALLLCSSMYMVAMFLGWIDVKQIGATSLDQYLLVMSPEI
jgi:hypothetical protein